MIAPPALAQSTATVQAGTLIPTRYEGKKILVTPTETAPVTLIVDQDIKAPLGAVLIPAGSQVKGQLQPAEGGSQFVASQIILPDGKQLTVDATSKVVTRKETIKKGPQASSILIGTAVGAGAATALSAIFGDVSLWKVLVGAGGGALAGTFLGRKSVELVSVNPNEDLDLTLRSNLVITYP
jgi:hypothetical protein